MAEKRKKEMEVQLFEDSVQDGFALYDATYHLHASQIDEIYIFYSKIFTIMLNVSGINC